MKSTFLIWSKALPAAEDINREKSISTDQNSKSCGLLDNEIVFGEGNANESVTKDDNTHILLWRDSVIMNAGKLTPIFPH